MSETDPPLHMSPQAFREHGRRVIDWIADYLESIERYPVLAQVAPGEIRAKMAAAPPQAPDSFESLLGDIDSIVLPGITHWQSPNFFAYFPANASGPAILGDLVSSGLGVQGMLWATSPACTEVETHILDWLADMLALPEHFRSTSTGGGVIQDTASSSVLCAILAARERATAFESNKSGAQQPLVAYTSREAHSMVEKAIRIAGVGSDNLRFVDVDEVTRAMKPDHLCALIEQDIAAGKIPFVVCATVGTTSSNGIDPVRAIGEVCESIDHKALTPGPSPRGRGGYAIWLHVDAAMSGTAALCPEFRWIHDGLEYADSYCFNPHKWMLTNFDCDAFYIRDRAALIQTLSVLPEYLRNQATESGAVIDYRDWHIPLGRRFRALKLWFVIRWYGVEGLRQHIRYTVNLAQQFKSWVEQSQDFEIAAPAPLNLVCFGHNGGDLINQRILERLNASGEIYLTHTRLNGRYTLRMAIGSPQTRIEHVRRAWQLIQDAASHVRS